MVVLVSHEDGHVDVGVQRRFAEVVGPHGQVEPPAVTAPVLRHQLEVDSAPRSDLAGDSVYSEVATVVPSDDSIADLGPD